MYLSISIVLQLTLFVYANPLHKYPFVFLLDVGNEELEKTSTEQIRVSVPGGSLALRYPAVGDGDTIGHVRVSGVDFGTDLKANIVDGGPGYKYVIVVFMGNPGVAYDAVITVLTIPEEVDESDSVGEALDNENNPVSTKLNEIPDELVGKRKFAKTEAPTKLNAELTQASSNYNYEINGDGNSNDDNDSGSQNDDDVSITNNDNENSQVINDVAENMAVESFSDEDLSNDSSQAAPLTADSSYDGEDEQIVVVDQNLYKKYEALKPHLSGDGKVYQEGTPEAEAAQGRSFDEDQEDPVELDQMFNDEEVHNDAGKYTDDNNNNTFDTDDSNAVEY